MLSLLSKQLRVPLGARTWTPPLWGVLLALAGALLFSRLGFWQLGRAAEKAQLAARYEARHRLPPLDLPGLLARGADIDDLPVRLAGRYDNSRLVYLDNQPRGATAGFHVYTAFQPLHSRRLVLVDRGWIPRGADVQRLPPVPEASATLVEGSAAAPSPFFTVGEPDYRQRPLRVGRLEMDKLERALGVELQPFVIRLAPSAPDGFVREWTPAARLGMPPAKHRAYAFQWFALAAAVLVVLLVVNLRKNPNPS
ncbi:MAG TPA: SURF1 family protein [Moraxellaceae bacterium]|nr:SURF1 family protein [Moraxellaceae bacterium]